MPRGGGAERYGPGLRVTNEGVTGPGPYQNLLQLGEATTGNFARLDRRARIEPKYTGWIANMLCRHSRDEYVNFSHLALSNLQHYERAVWRILLAARRKSLSGLAR